MKTNYNKLAEDLRQIYISRARQKKQDLNELNLKNEQNNKLNEIKPKNETTSRNTIEFKTKVQAFGIAKEIAKTIRPGFSKRAQINGKLTNFVGYKEKNGTMWVMADNETDFVSYDKILYKKYAKQIFD